MKETRVVRCEVTDGCRPRGGPSAYRLGSPHQFEMRSDERLSIALGVSFDVPVVVYQFHGLQRQGVRLDNNAMLFEAGQDIVADLESMVPPGAEDLLVMLERGDTLLVAVPQAHRFVLEF